MYTTKESRTNSILKSADEPECAYESGQIYVTEHGFLSVNHVGEQLCGDSVAVVEPDGRTKILVLADGMGSGVKANILSTLTATMMSSMLAKNVDFDECVRTIISTLPICRVRKVAYSTFTVIRVRDAREVQIYNYDNPAPFLIRKGRSEALDFTWSEVAGKRIQQASFTAEPGDCFVMMSDGTLNAGLGITLNYGWDLPEIMEFMETNWHEDSSAKALATSLVDRCSALYGGEPADDTTCAVVRIRERRPVNLMFGPPERSEDDRQVIGRFLELPGQHLVAGGTTAAVVARCLGKSVEPNPVNMDETLPPMSLIEGIDLVTEGMLTLQRVCEYGENCLGPNDAYFNWNFSLDGASLLSCALFEEATDVRIFFGGAVNPAHQEGTGIGYQEKLRLVTHLADLLRKMNKTVQVEFC